MKKSFFLLSFFLFFFFLFSSSKILLNNEINENLNPYELFQNYHQNIEKWLIKTNSYEEKINKLEYFHIALKSIEKFILWLIKQKKSPSGFDSLVFIYFILLIECFSHSFLSYLFSFPFYSSSLFSSLYSI